MNAFSLSASGENFDVGKFLEKSTLIPTRIFRRGEPKGAPPWSGQYAISGVTFELGDGQILPITEQETIAIAFLKANREELRSLAQFSGVTRCVLGVHCRREKTEANLYAFSICTSPSLMWHLLDTGYTLSHLVTLEYVDAEDGT